MAAVKYISGIETHQVISVYKNALNRITSDS